MAARHHTDSSEMAGVMGQDGFPGRCHRDKHDEKQQGKTDNKHEEEKEICSKQKQEETCDKHKHDKENSSQQEQNEEASSSDNRSDQASCSSSSSSSSSFAGRGGRRQSARNEPTSSVCCSLESLRRLPQCEIQLGKLAFSKTHTILVDVRSLFTPRTLA